MKKYETILGRYVAELGILKDMQDLNYKVLSVDMVLNYLAAATEKAFVLAEDLAQFDASVKVLIGVMYQGAPNIGKGLLLRRAIMRDECENALLRVDTLQAIYEIIEGQNEVPISEIR